ncbi:AGAP005082-PA, related [Eimeria brunetti]|uniref:AGAP005082-PA, related n=1 Tax=Eimeria brunetti TaxID=51314 RepID=U6L9X1_9EIME|nr:AGAP005082-PA, related [Eimeria brunetti]
MHKAGNSRTRGKEKPPDDPDLRAVAGAVRTASLATSTATPVNLEATDTLQASGKGESGKGEYTYSRAAAELKNSGEVARGSPRPAVATPCSKMLQAAEAPGTHKSEPVAGNEDSSDGASSQEQKQNDAIEAAVNAAIAVAADTTTEQEEAPADMAQEGGRASSVLSTLLSAVLRQLLPWVLPSALQGASAAEVKVSISKKQLMLSGVSLQPQELTALTGAPLHLLHCSIGELQLKMGRQAGAAGAVTAPFGTAASANISGGDAAPDFKAAAAADGAAKSAGKEEPSPLWLSVKDVIIVLAPTSPQEWSRQQLLELALQRRRSLLYNMDSELQVQQMQQRSGFPLCMYRLFSHWVDRHVQWASLDAKNVHLRVEFLLPPCHSSSSTGSAAFAFGVHLEELHMRTFPPEKAGGSAGLEAKQQQDNQGTAATPPQPRTEATAEASPSSGTSPDCNIHSRGSICTEFDVKGCSMYTQDELLLLAPHTRTAAENIERLCAVPGEQKQQGGRRRSQEAEEEQPRPGQNNEVQPGCRVQRTIGSKQQQPSILSRCNGCLLAPLAIHGVLRKNSVVAHSRQNTSDGGSSSVIWPQGDRRSATAVLNSSEATSSTGPSYVVSVESGCLEVSFSPRVIRGLRWLSKNVEVHRKGVDAAEAILSLVRPFVPSCTVCRLRRSRRTGENSNSSTFATGSQFDISGDGMAAEEILKLRLCSEKAAMYRRLRVLQLQGTLTQRQLNQMLQIRDSLPLPQLLQSHADSRQDFLDQQAETCGAGTAKTWARWLFAWKEGSLRQASTVAAKSSAPGEVSAVAGAELRPPIPPLSLQSLLDQHRIERQMHQESGQQTTQNGRQQQQRHCGQQETFPEDFDDFYDARSQPATARLNSSSLRLCAGRTQDSAPALVLEASKEIRRQMQAHDSTPAGKTPYIQPSGVSALRGAYTGEGASQGERQGEQGAASPTAVAPAAARSNSESTLGRGNDFSDGDETFYDCVDLQTPRPTAQVPPGGGASGGTLTTCRTPFNAMQSSVPFPAVSKQVAYTISVSVSLRFASVAFCLDELKSSRAGTQKEQRSWSQRQQQGRQQGVSNIILCGVGPLRVSGIIGNEMLEGDVSVDRLDVSCSDWGLHREHKLVFMDSITGDEPVLSLHVSQNTASPAFALTVEKDKSCNQDPEEYADTRRARGDKTFKKPSILLSLMVHRVVCILDPHALKEAAALRRGFSSAAAGGELVATEASQQCSLLHLSGCARPGNKCRASARDGNIEAESRAHNINLHERPVHLSPKGHPQVLDGGSLSYAVFVENPTVVFPASEGRAIMCRLGELRVCSAHLEQAQLLGAREPEVKEPLGFRFADASFQDRYTHILKACPSSAAAAEVAGAVRPTARTRLWRHSCRRTHHGLLLRDSHILLHNNLKRLEEQLMLQQFPGFREPMNSYDFQKVTCRSGRWKDRRHVEPVPQPQEDTSARNSCDGGKHEGWNLSGSAREVEQIFSSWGTCDFVQPLLFSSELVATVEVERVSTFAPGVVSLPLNMPLYQERTLRRLQKRPLGRDFRTTAFELRSCQRSASKGTQQGSAQQDALRSLPQRKQCWHQEQQQVNAHDEQDQRLCEIQIYVNGKCNEVRASLSRHSCAAILSAFDSLKTALPGNDAILFTAERPSFDSAFRTSGLYAGVPSSPNDGCNSVKAPEAGESCRSITMCIDVSLEFGKLGIYLHRLRDNTEGQKPTEEGNASSGRVREETANAEDALQLQATDVSAHLSNMGCVSVCGLEMKQLLLEQPYFPADSINRCILLVPRLDRFSATGGVASHSFGEPGIRLSFTSGTRSPSTEGTAPTVSVHVLQPMTFNFRPTPLTWFVSFLKAPFGSYACSSCMNSTCTGKGTRPEGESCRSQYEAYNQCNKNNGCAQQPEAEGESPLKPLNRAGLPPEADATKPPHEGETGAQLPHSVAQGDSVLREILVEFQTVNFLWSARGSDNPLATASVSAASVSLHIRRYSTKITGKIKDLIVNFVIPGVKSTLAAFPRSRSNWEGLDESQQTQRPRDAPLEHCTENTPMQHRFPRTAILQTTEIIGLVPGRSYALSFSLESVHPLSPQFSGISSNLKVDVGTCRVVYVHPKFWRLFDWIIDDFIGTLAASRSPAVSSPQATGLGNISASQEAPPKPIERSPSLEDLVTRSVLQSGAAVEMPASPCAVHRDEQDSTSEGLINGLPEKQPLIVPNEGLRRIFLLADAGRSLLGLSPLFQDRQEGLGNDGGADSKLHRLVLPQALPFSVFHYEVQITSPRLLLPAACRPNSGDNLWPPVLRSDGDSNSGCEAWDRCCSTMTSATGGHLGTCKKCTDYPPSSASSAQASRREVICLLDSFTVSNSWNLSRVHGIVESINVMFKGAKAFAKIYSPHNLYRESSKAASGPAYLHCREGPEASYLEGSCRRCARRIRRSALSSRGESEAGLYKARATAESVDSEITAASTVFGRYLFGSVDLVVRMFRPVLLRSSSRWLRVEAGLLPLTLDVQTLGLVFDIVEDNITANDPDIAVENVWTPPLVCNPAGSIRGWHGLHSERGTEEILASKSDARFPASSPVSQSVFETTTCNIQEDLSELVQKMLGNHTLQGLLEPQVDFIELLEEWGHATFLLELLIDGVHLAVTEQPLQNQAQLRSLRLQPDQAEQVGLLLPSATLASPWTSLAKLGENQHNLDKARTPPLTSPPATGTFIRMRIGSSTLFSPELAPPFSVVFTDSACPVGLLQQQLEPIADSVRRAERDAVGAATATARIDEILGAQTDLAYEVAQKEDKQVKESDIQLTGDSQQPLLEEHPLVAPFATPWIEPLQLPNATQDASTDGRESISRESLVGGSARVADNGQSPLLRSGTSRADSSEAALGSAVQVPPSNRDYGVVFRCGFQPQQQQRRERPRVPTQSLVPLSSELTFVYKSASAVPVIPLNEEHMLKVSKPGGGTLEETVQILQRLLLQRQHRRKQKRIAVSSTRPRCVLDLPLLSRISAFLSNNKATSGDVRIAADAFGDTAPAVMASRGNWDSVEGNSAVTTLLGRPSHCRGRRISCSRHTSCGSNKGNPSECPAAPNEGSAACLQQGVATGDRSSKQGSGSDSALSSRCNSESRDCKQKQKLRCGTFSAEAELTQFGSRALALCRSSFDSAKRFAAELSHRCSSELQLAEFTEDVPIDGDSNEPFFETRSETIRSGEVGGKPLLSRRSALLRKETVAVATPRRQELPPLQLNSMEVDVSLTDASLLLPVDSKACDSSSVLLRGSVNVSRRADDVRDPIYPQGTSKDSEFAASAYEHVQNCDSKGSRQKLWAGGTLSAASAEADGAPKKVLQEEEAFWQCTTKFLDTLPDRFCPGVRGVDVLVQKAAVTCLRSSTPLRQLGASVADAPTCQKNLDIRTARRLRWTNRTGTCTGTPTKSSTQLNLEGTGSEVSMPGELRPALDEVHVEPHLRGVRSATPYGERTSGASTFSPSAFVKCQGNFHAKGRVCGESGVPDENLAATNSETSVTEFHGNARSICSGLRAQIRHVFVPPASRCPEQEGVSVQPASHAAGGGIDDASGGSCEGQRRQHVGRRQEDCCCCLMNGEGSIDAGVNKGTLGPGCDCCCHHPQEYTALQTSACELELSYLDCLLVCRCAAEQTMQLERQQQRQQAQLIALQRLLHRIVILEEQLSMKQRLLQKQGTESDGKPPAPPASRSSTFPCSVYLGTHRRTRKRLLSPAAAVPSFAQQNIEVPPAYPRQRRVSARLPLLRLTLLDDRLDCLQAPLLQFLVLNCRLSQACSVLPPHDVEAPLLDPQGPEKPQVSSVCLLNASLRLWAFNPLAVAFEPVVESLPLLLVVRETPYLLMRSAYSSCSDNDSLALSVRQRTVGSRGLQHKTSWPPPYSYTHESCRGTLLKKTSSSSACTPSQRMSSSNRSSTSNTENDTVGSVSPVLFRLSESATAGKACAFENQQQEGPSPSEPLTTVPPNNLMKELSLRGRNSVEASMGSTHAHGSQSGIEGDTDARNRAKCRSATDAVSSSGSSAKRHLGIFVSSMEEGSIEANLSPLLLQSVLGSLCKWHYDFTHHVEQQQRQQQNTWGSTSTCETSTTSAQACHQLVTRQLQRKPLQHQEEHPASPNYARGQCTGGQEELHGGAGDMPGGQRQSLFANTIPLQRRPSRSMDASPACPPAVQDRHTKSSHNTCGSLPEALTDGSSDIQLPQGGQRQFQEAADPKRDKLFVPYLVVNQTGRHLGVLLVPKSAGLRAPDSEGLSLNNVTHAAATVPGGLPPTLRLCWRHNRNVGASEEDGSGCDSSSSTSEAEVGRALAGVPIHWGFGSTLQTVACGSTGSASAASSGNVKETFSCPSSPSSSREGKPIHPELKDNSAGWDWLQPSEEKALTQMRVSIGTASTAHVALQLAKQPMRTDAAVGSIGSTLRKNTSLQTEECSDEPGVHADGSYSRWRLRRPVPLDRVGVYIQPLPDMETAAATGPTVAASGTRMQRAPFVICRLIADAGKKQLLVQSQVVLRSSCSVPLQVRLLPHLQSANVGQQEKNERPREDNEGAERFADFIVKPGETSAVPVDFCFTGRLRIRPVQADKEYSWSRDLSLGVLWQAVDGTEQQKPSGTGVTGEAGQEAFKLSFPKTDVLRCCPLVGSSISKGCLKRNPSLEREDVPKENKRVDNDKLREPDYHIVVLYRPERLVHSSFSCVQLKVSLEAPLRLASNIPFPVRYRINCPLVVKAGEDPPGDSEGLLQLNEWQQLHSFPLAGGDQAPAECVTGGSTDPGKRESSGDTAIGETIVEVECFDSKYRSAKIWVIFCNSEGGSPCLLLHSPVWLVSHIQWALQKQWLKQPQEHCEDDPADGQKKRLAAVEYSIIRRTSPAELGWAMQAVSAAAAAVDLNRDAERSKPSQLPNFTNPSGSRKGCSGDIRLLDFSTSSIRVEADGIGCSKFLDLWGDFPRSLSVSASCAEGLTADSRYRATAPDCSRPGRTIDIPASPCEERPLLGTAVGGPCLDIVAAMSEAPLPLLRPVLLLTISPMYTITNQCPFPIRVQQARSGCHCSGTRCADARSVDFTLEIQPQNTEALVWQFEEGSRSLQLQGLMPTLCWLHGGCKRWVSTPRDSGLPETVWSSWSGYSPLCLSGDDWCLRLPSAPSELRRTTLETLETHRNGPGCFDPPLRCNECEFQDPKHRQEHSGEGEVSRVAIVEPQELLGALLRRGVSVQMSETQPSTKRHLPELLTRQTFSASGCSALRLETAEGPANTVNLTVQMETFDMRDTVSIRNDTPLPLLFRQCRHRETQQGTETNPEGCQQPAVFQKLGLTEAAAFGVDSVATAVAELWGAATQGEGLQQDQLSPDTGEGFAHHDHSNEGGHGRSTQLLNMLLEAQKHAEQQQKTRRSTGEFPFHSSETVYISAAPREEGTHLQLDRLARIANAAAIQKATEQLQPQDELGNFSIYKAGVHCCWCTFESAVSQELCGMQEEAMTGPVGSDSDGVPSSESFLPQLVLPGETALFTWDDYRCLPCIELTYFPWLHQHGEEKKSASAKELDGGSRRITASPVPARQLFDSPFVVCIPLRPGVRGVVPLSPVPSSYWPVFHVVRRAGRLLMRIAPAGEILGINSSPHNAVEQNHQDTMRHMNSESSRVSSWSDATNTSAGNPMSPWAEADTDQVTASRNDVDANSLLVLPRYFQLPVVMMDLTAGCSRIRETSSGSHCRVPPWSFASMCKFAGTLVGSYASDRRAKSGAVRATNLPEADAGCCRDASPTPPVQPTPDPPTFEFRIQVPRLQFSVLSQGAITDPLSRQTFRLPEELFLVTFEGLSAAYFRSPFHSAAACRVQELQIDSMHSQAYYPVLLQRAPPLPSEAGSVADSNITQVSRTTGSTSDNTGEGASGSSGASLPACGSKSKDGGGALLEFLLQQRLPFYGSRDDRVIVVDKCSLSLKPVSIRTDLKSVYMASEALSCWRSAWAAATRSVGVDNPGTPPRTPAFCHHQRWPIVPLRESSQSPASRGDVVSSEDEDLEFHYASQSGLAWAYRGNRTNVSPVSLFVSQIAGTGLVRASTPLAVRPFLCRPNTPVLQEQEKPFSQQREQRYVFRVLTIASTCVVLSFKADTGGNSSAFHRSVVTLSSLEDAWFEVNGLHMTARRLMDQLKELHQQQQPHMHQDCSLLAKLIRHHRHPALALRDVAMVAGHFYQQQLLSHLSKLLVSVDVLGNPALSLAHLQAGVYALAKQPMEAAESGGDVFEGMMRGAEDFLKHTGYGVFGGISRMAGVASDSLGALACDEVYVHTRKQQGRHKARNVEEGLQQGVEALGRALAGGFTGLVEEPVRGAAEGGFEGLLRGAGRGIAGFLVKPLTGVLDLAHKTAEAIKDASQVEGRQRPRFRLPRLLLGDFRLLVAYDAEAAEAKAILADAEGQYWENLPVLFFALDRRLQALTVLTASNILFFKCYSRNHAELRFLAPLSCLLTVGHCSTPSSSTSTDSGSSRRIQSRRSKHRHALVLQLRQEGESGVYYQQLLYSSARLQGHILNSLRQLLLQ